MLYDPINNSLKLARIYTREYGRVIWASLISTFKTAFNFVDLTTNCKKTRKLLTYLNTCVSTGTFIQLGIHVVKGRRRNPIAVCIHVFINGFNVFDVYFNKITFAERIVFDDVFVMLLPLAIQLIVLFILNL